MTQGVCFNRESECSKDKVFDNPRLFKDSMEEII